MEYFNKVLSTAKRKRKDYEVLDDSETCEITVDG